MNTVYNNEDKYEGHSITKETNWPREKDVYYYKSMIFLLFNNLLEQLRTFSNGLQACL